MKLKQTNHGQKCPNCKKFGLKPFHRIYSCSPNGYETPGHFIDNINCVNFYRCLNCFAEFEEIKDDT